MDVYVGNFRNLKTSLRGSAGQWSWLLRNQKRRGWNCGCQGADGHLAPRNIFAILAKKGETPWKSWNIPEFWRIIWWIMIQSGGFPYFLCLQPLTVKHCWLVQLSSVQMLHELVEPSPWLGALPDFLAWLKTSLMRPVMARHSSQPDQIQNI